MKNSKEISLKQIKEAIKQADANIKFEEVIVDYQKVHEQPKIKSMKRGNNYDKRSLG